MSHSREVISLHVGQAGIQLGNAVWETMVTEHGIKANGLAVSPEARSSLEESSLTAFFHLSPTGQYMPRTLIVDSEPTVIDEIRTGFYRNLFHPDLLMSGIEDAANNYARGYYTIGHKMLHQLLDKVRFIVESCDNLIGFMSYSGSGGGTGSGLYSILMDRIMLEFTGKTTLGSLILPGRSISDTIVDPYNSVLRISQSISTNINLMMDNESMYKICHDKLNILRPTYTNINRLVSPIISSITAPFRFHGPLTSDLLEMSTNLIPYPRINFPTLGYSPFISKESNDHSLLNSEQLLYNVFQQDHSFLGLDLQKGKMMSSVLAFRGIHQMGAIIERLSAMKTDRTFKWVDWCPTGFKITQTLYPALHQNLCGPCQSSVLMMCNHSEVTSSIGEVCRKFSMLFQRRSFIHWFVGEGMEFEEILDGINNVNFLKQDYEEICKNHDQDSKEYLSSNINVQENVVQTQSKENQIESLDSFESVDKEIPNPGEVVEVNETLVPAKGSKDEKSTDVKKNRSADSFVSSENEIEAPFMSRNSNDFRTSGSYQMNAKAKEILFNNVTTLSAEQKQRMFGFVE